MHLHQILLNPLVLLAAVTVLVGCKPADTPPPPPPPTGEFCDGAAQVLKTLQCADERGVIEGNGNALGESYVDICKRVERVGKVTMRSECISKSKNCDEVKICQRQLALEGAAWAPVKPRPPASSTTMSPMLFNGPRSAVRARSWSRPAAPPRSPDKVVWDPASPTQFVTHWRSAEPGRDRSRS